MPSARVYRFASAMLLAGMMIGSALPVNAAVITHGSFTGSSVIFQNVVETPSTMTELFGAPTLVEDDTLVFMPQNFTAAPNAPDLTEIIDSQIRFTVCGINGGAIPQLLFEELGTVSLSSIEQNGFAMATVGMPIFWHIIEMDGTPIDGPSGNLNMTFTPSNGIFMVDGIGEIDALPWSGSALIDFNAIIANNPLFSGSATKVEITFDNTLSVADFGSSNSSITKTKLRISVPEVPASILLLCVIPIALMNRRVRSCLRGAA